MSTRRVVTVTAAAVFSLAAPVLAAPVLAAPVLAASPPVSAAHVAVHFDLAAGQRPENIALEPDGAADVTFAFIGRIARVTHGRVQVLAVLPAPPAGSVAPILHHPFLGGIVLSRGTRYVSYSTGSAALNGIWRVRPGHRPARITALPAGSLANGLALDQRAGLLYVADSALGVIWRSPVGGGPATVWARSPELKRAGFLGVNGIKVHDGAVWASNTDKATLLRIPVRHGGAAGPVGIAASGLTNIDDFTFTAGGDVLAALDSVSKVALVRPNGTHTIVLTAADGLSNPTSVAVSGGTVYVTSAAYLTGTNPNLLTARLAGQWSHRAGRGAAHPSRLRGWGRVRT